MVEFSGMLAILGLGFRALGIEAVLGLELRVWVLGSLIVREPSGGIRQGRREWAANGQRAHVFLRGPREPEGSRYQGARACNILELST